MRAKLVVFPIKGKNWCFSRSIDPAPSEFSSANTPSTVKELYKKISSNSKPLSANAELLIDFVSNKMNKSLMGLEKAPEGSFKNKLHGLGLRLLARVTPSEILLKSITKEVTNVQITYPTRGTVIHRKYFYGSVSLLPLTTAFTVLPLPNIPFFWVLFRTYSHWQALQVRLHACCFLLEELRSVLLLAESAERIRWSGSEKLLQLVSDHSQDQNSIVSNGKEPEHKDSECGTKNLPNFKWVSSCANLNYGVDITGLYDVTLFMFRVVVLALLLALLPLTPTK
ncbi:Regulatory particle triple-A 1A [Hibiscus syriacus]|uniref:Regulatory particle triple-A 1A n=1 Tax=Hibiscus syriacus TaxID=106335 RepID=A0A6A2X4E9_HIBSY|nr:Regulatory particle triple-A 1A [Hibiscus syriacus]